MSIVPHALTKAGKTPVPATSVRDSGARDSGALITHSVAETSLSVSDLPALLKQWMAFESEIASLNAQIREKRSQSKALRASILGVMEKHNVVQLNVTKGSVLHKTREKKESLSHDFIFKAAKQFFDDDEEKAKRLVDFLESQRGTTVVHDLKLAVPKSKDSDSASM
jgi:hypothetical protein